MTKKKWAISIFPDGAIIRFEAEDCFIYENGCIIFFNIVKDTKGYEMQDLVCAFATSCWQSVMRED